MMLWLLLVLMMKKKMTAVTRVTAMTLVLLAMAMMLNLEEESLRMPIIQMAIPRTAVLHMTDAVVGL